MIGLLLALVLVGAILYVVEKHLPMDPAILTLIRIVVVIIVILWLIQVFGLLDIPVPKFNR